MERSASHIRYSGYATYEREVYIETARAERLRIKYRASSLLKYFLLNERRINNLVKGYIRMKIIAKIQCSTLLKSISFPVKGYIPTPIRANAEIA
ncbi:hypothetical protein CVU76_00285 [Candidatus Dojkabacteria bacterium HGW-Dojkabacteria-1]|uniref:Uncharacterized protein n=1 Tax=Candidatus Dojkabacteria bacterium HGW-Dojkabacteria-1 TaxID=2013761 RepID=A0A2N2F2Q5_9BACT|nr:MAG: hypothetical protein CVU76_00285 [Candidatus Dojkabacteria bacterium HGW-Dojkabacteria-1]